MPAAEEVGNPVMDVTVIPQRKAPSSQSPTQQSKRACCWKLASSKTWQHSSFFPGRVVYNSPGTKNLNLQLAVTDKAKFGFKLSLSGCVFTWTYQ